MTDTRSPYESGLCCMAAHAAASRQGLPWTCVCPCHQIDPKKVSDAARVLALWRELNVLAETNADAAEIVQAYRQRH